MGRTPTTDQLVLPKDIGNFDEPGQCQGTTPAILSLGPFLPWAVLWAMCSVGFLPALGTIILVVNAREITEMPVEIFTKLFGSLLAFVYHGFDRIVILGHLPLLTRPENIVRFFREVHHVSAITKDVLRQRTGDYHYRVIK